MFKKIYIGVIGALLIFSISGCSVSPNASELDKIETTFSIEPMTSNMSSDFTENIKITAARKAEIHLGGSGTCPPEIERVNIHDGIISLKLKDWGDKICTLDYRLYSQLLTTDSDIDLNDYNFEVCNPLEECKALVKNSAIAKESEI